MRVCVSKEGNSTESAFQSKGDDEDWWAVLVGKVWKGRAWGII